MRVQAVNSLAQTYSVMDVAMTESAAVRPVRRVADDVTDDSKVKSGAEVAAQSQFVSGDGLADYRRITANAGQSQNSFSGFKRRFFA